MSKYNHMKSIPVDSIPKEDISQAIKEWAEGDEALEKFLWACYEKGIKTSGCHVGAGPYIQFEYQEGLDNLLDVTQKTMGSHIHVSVEGGNPVSGPDWDKPDIMFSLDTKYQDEADAYFNELTNSLKDDISEKKENSLFKLLDFFIDKESALSFRFTHINDNQYEFDIYSSTIPDSRYDYYDNIFTKAGLAEDSTIFIEGDKRHRWKIESNNIEDIQRKMENATEYIINNYTLPAPTSEDEIYSFNSHARLMKKNLSKEEFEKWLEETDEKIRKHHFVGLIMNAKNQAGEFSFGDIGEEEKMNIMLNVQKELRTKTIDELHMMLSAYQEKNVQEEAHNENNRNKSNH